MGLLVESDNVLGSFCFFKKHMLLRPLLSKGKFVGGSST